VALDKPIETIYGITLESSYARINTLTGSKNLVGFALYYYVSRNDYLNGCVSIKQESYEFVPNIQDGSDNFIKQGYEYLKTLPEFSNALDVIE